jgi:transcription initiation factor TFIID subunit 1, fungi type
MPTLIGRIKECTFAYGCFLNWHHVQNILTRQHSVDKELERLLKNVERRKVREKQGKGKRKKHNITDAPADDEDASPEPSGSLDKAAGGTTRKCANCGQVGHIKTNKRYYHRCLLLL